MFNQQKGGNCYECGKFIPNCLSGNACHCRESCSKNKKNWEKSLNINKRFVWATPGQRDRILIEIKFQRKGAREEFKRKIFNSKKGDKIYIPMINNKEQTWVLKSIKELKKE